MMGVMDLSAYFLINRGTKKKLAQFGLIFFLRSKLMTLGASVIK